MEKLTLGNTLESYGPTMMWSILLYNICCVLGNSYFNRILGLKGSLENNLVHTFFVVCMWFSCVSQGVMCCKLDPNCDIKK